MAAQDSAIRGAIQWVGYFLSRAGATIESVAEQFDVRFPGMPSYIRQIALSQGQIIYGQAQEANVGQGNLPLGHYFGYPASGEPLRVRVRFQRGPTRGNLDNWITQEGFFPAETTQEDVIRSLAEQARGVIAASNPSFGLSKTGSDWSELIAADTETGYSFEFLPTVAF